ncbi:MAG: ABC transporter ATP-binding protein [Bacteroidetes bacterium]|nr:ABC transporter ATP-binding protein [Bacteroidota bacterium]MDA0972447.1 ABC transporter ATP-binding protein [Bacteroidota bacterium]
MASSVSGKAFDMGLFRRMMSFAAPYRSRVIGTMSLIILLAILGPLRPFLIDQMIQGPIRAGDAQSLLNWTLLIVSLLVAESILQFYQTYSANMLGQNVILDIRIKLFRHLSGFRLRYFDKTPIGRLVTRAVSDIETISEVFASGILIIFGDILKLLIVIGFMFYLNWVFTLVVLIPVPILLFATRLFKNAIEKAFKKVRTQVSRLNTFVQEHIQGMSIVQVFGREEEEERRFKVINAEHRKAHIDSVWAYSIFFPVVEILSSISMAFLILYGMRAVGHEPDPYSLIGDVFAFTLYIHMLYRPIRQLADRFNVLQMGMVGAERVMEVFDTEAKLEGTENRTDVALSGDIVFDDVWLAYNEEDFVLKGISLTVKKGQNVALVGSTGAGKTSIINLIGRFYEFQKGRVLLDGVDIRSIEPSHLRSHLAVVQQDVFLYSDTIEGNITLGNPNISTEEVIEGAKAVGAHEFIMRLPLQYQTQVAERGRLLSVGQRQLISFIRAYVHQPDILILDEATSSIDSESEALIQRAQEYITRGRTSIVIAHRLSTIKRADMIYVMDKGRIVEQGKHEELLETGGMYKRLYDLQFK